MDLFVTGEGGGFDPVRELMTGSDDPSELLARTRLTDKEIARDMRILGRRQRYRKGSTNVDDLIRYRLIAVISRESEGRKEAVDMVTGLVRARQPYLDASNLLERSRSHNNGVGNKREAPQA